MHDAELVPNWDITFDSNTQLLNDMFTPELLATSTSQLADKFPELVVSDAETPNLFTEVLRNNSYQLDMAQMRNKEVIDVGANVGFFSLAAAALGAYKVISVEPSSYAHNQLIRNISLTGLTHKIIPIKQAVMGQPAPPLMLGIHDHHGSNSMYVPSTHHELVPIITLADLVKYTYSNNVILKLDCEGAEFDIILDSAPEVFDRIKQIHIEIHTNLHPVHKHRDVIAHKLTDLGFTCRHSKNVGIWWYNEKGEAISWDPGHFFVDIWNK